MSNQPENNDFESNAPRTKHLRHHDITWNFRYCPPTSDQLDLQQQAFKLITKWAITAAKKLPPEAIQSAPRLDFVPVTCDTVVTAIGG